MNISRRAFFKMGIPAAAALGLSAAGRKVTPGAAAAGRPNVLVIMTDDQDAASLPVMRQLMSFPHGSWVHFTNAFANDAICSPSRATLLTGQYSHRHGVVSNAAKHTGKLNQADTLAESGQLENTLIVFLSDQGFSWGSHRWFYKHAAYDECSRFPLLVRYPGAENREERRFVSNVSLAATICEWAGVEPGRPVDGASLIPLLSGASVAWDETLLIEKRAGSPNNSNFWGVRSPGWLYAEYENGDVELYDTAADPWQMESVHGRPEYAGIRAELRARLEALAG